MGQDGDQHFIQEVMEHLVKEIRSSGQLAANLSTGAVLEMTRTSTTRL